MLRLLEDCTAVGEIIPSAFFYTLCTKLRVLACPMSGESGWLAKWGQHPRKLGGNGGMNRS